MRACGLILFVCVCAFDSCQKKFESPGNIFANAPASFIAQVDGAPFVGSIFGAAIRPDGIISIAAKSDEYKTIVFTVVDSGVHVYTLDVKSVANVGGYIDVGGIAFTSNGGRTADESGGKLAITYIDTVRKLITGTFNFKGFRQADRQQRIITGGDFRNVSYQ